VYGVIYNVHLWLTAKYCITIDGYIIFYQHSLSLPTLI